MSFVLPESMRAYIDQEEQARKRLRDLIEEGLASGPGHHRSKADEHDLLAIARGVID